MRIVILAASAAALMTLGACDDEQPAPASQVNVNVEAPAAAAPPPPPPPPADEPTLQIGIDPETGDVDAKVKTDGVEVNIE